MPETLTASFCERCGARHDFRAASGLGPLRRTRGFVAGLKNYLVSQDALSEALRQGIRAEEDALGAAQLDAFHESVHLCIECRQYTCVDCWNDAAGRCRSCAPVPGLDDLAERIAANAFGAAAETNGGMAGDARAGALAADANGRPHSPGDTAHDLEWPDLAAAGHAGAPAAESWPAFDLTDETAPPTPDAPDAGYPLAVLPEDEAIAAENERLVEARDDAVAAIETQPHDDAVAAHADTDAMEPVSGDAGGWWLDAAARAAAEEDLAEKPADATLVERVADEPSIAAADIDATAPAPLRVVAWDEDEPIAATGEAAPEDAVATQAASEDAVAAEAASAADPAADALAAQLKASLQAARQAASEPDAAAIHATQPIEPVTAAHDDPDAWLRAAEPVAETVLLEAEAAEAVSAESEAAPEPVSAEADGEPAMDDWAAADAAADAAAHHPVPDAPASDAGATTAPAPDAPAAPATPRVPPVRITRLRQTILPFPGRGTAPAERDDRAAASNEDSEVAAARRAQLENLGLGDPGQGPVAAEGSVLPYRSRGATAPPAHMQARGASVWEASAREVAGGTGPITVHTCGGCGLALSASARFCRRCGSPQARSA